MYGVCCLYFILARFLVGLGRVAWQYVHHVRKSKNPLGKMHRIAQRLGSRTCKGSIFTQKKGRNRSGGGVRRQRRAVCGGSGSSCRQKPFLLQYVVEKKAQGKGRLFLPHVHAILCTYYLVLKSASATSLCFLKHPSIQVNTDLIQPVSNRKSHLFADREELEAGDEGADAATYRHVAHLWQNWLPPKAMTTLEKGKNNSVQCTLYVVLRNDQRKRKRCNGNDMAERVELQQGNLVEKTRARELCSSGWRRQRRRQQRALFFLSPYQMLLLACMVWFSENI